MNISSKRLLLLVLSIVLLSGCYTTKVVATHKNDTFANNPQNTKMVWFYVWGLVQPKEIDPKCESGHLSYVHTRSTWLHSVLTVVTLGIVHPVKVKWACTPKNMPTEQLGN